MYMNQFPTKADPIRYWGFPRRFAGATMFGTKYWDNPSIEQWKRAAHAGNVFGGEGPLVGTGITAVSDDLWGMEYLTALFGDLMRGSTFRDVTAFQSSQVSVTSASNMNAQMREGTDEFKDARLLVVHDVNADDKWPLYSLEQVMSTRFRRGQVTWIATNQRTLALLADKDKSPQPGLWRHIDGNTFLVYP